MFRAGTVVAALILFLALAPPASAQPQRQLPNSPGIMPGFGPNAPLVVPRPAMATAAFNRGASPVYFPVAMPWGWGLGWGYETYNPWTGYGYNYAGVVPPLYAPPPVIVEVPPSPPPLPEPMIALANEFPATLTLQFPAAADVWLNGKKVEGTAAEERVLTSPVLKPDQKYTFNVKARWKSGGKTFEAKRAVLLGGADKSRLFILSGDEVRE
jgi:uncharacterized protein (TIGR03000 family)